MNNDTLVYSTETGRIPQEKQTPAAPKGDGIVRIRRETKGRKGKGVTTVSGLLLEPNELKKLCTELKKTCGTGGAVKGNIIEIQGDNKEKSKLYLKNVG